MKHFQAVLFDMDGVLIDSEPLWKRAEIDVMLRYGVSISNETIEEIVGLQTKDVVAHWIKTFDLDSSLQVVLEHEIHEAVIQLILKEGKERDSISDLIEHFKSNDLPIAVASSSDYKIIHTVLEKLQLKKQFDVVHSAQDESHGKPHPAVFLGAAKKLQALPTSCLVIEDSLNGIIAGKAARATVWGVPDSAHFTSPKFQIADKLFEDITAVFDFVKST